MTVLTDLEHLCCQVEDRTCLTSELSVVAAQEKVMLDECRELLAMAAELEVLTFHSQDIPSKK